MSRAVHFGLTISEEQLGDKAPVLLQGGLIGAMKRAAELGFDAVEIHIRNPKDLDWEKLRQTAAHTNIHVAAVGTGLEHTMNGLNLASPDASLRRRTSERFREHIELAALFGATVFVGLCRGRVPTPDQREVYLDRLARELVPLVRYADTCGASLSVEPIVSTMTNLLNSTRETIEFIERPGLESLHLLMDTHHMYYEDGDIANTLDMCGNRIGHFHISDSDRKYPGSGNVDYDMVGTSLKRINYDKTVSLEILPYPDGETAALKGLEWMLATWGE